jgi:hypothetical protein
MDKNEKRGETYLMKNLWRRKIKSLKKKLVFGHCRSID